MVKELRSCTDQLVNLLDDTRVMIDTMDSYVPSMLDALGATEELMNRLAKAMGSTESVLRAVHNYSGSCRRFSGTGEPKTPWQECRSC